MKSEIRHSLGQASGLSNPLLAPDVTVADYLTALKLVTDFPKKSTRLHAEYAIRIMERWLQSRFNDEAALPMNEAMLEELAQDLALGKFLREDGTRYQMRTNSVTTTIRYLHNRLVDTKQVGFQRKFVHRLVWLRLQRYARLTKPTQDILLYLEQTGRRATRKNKRTARPMTESTRGLAISSTLRLLDRVGRGGVELVTRNDIDILRDKGDQDNRHKTIARMLHNAGPVFRLGKERGLMADNVLDTASSDTFKQDARRDFLPPDQVDKMLDLSTLDWSDNQMVRDRLVVLLLYDLAVRRSELAGMNLDDVTEVDGQYEIRLRPEVQKNVKPLKRLFVYFPATRDVLRHYLTHIRGSSPGKLILDRRGKAASAAAIENAVARESGPDRLNLVCYRSDRRPTPHAFRRTFATINCHPHGLGLAIHELADRLRDSIRVVDESYRLQNPLMDEKRAEHYQKKLAAQIDPKESVQSALQQLEQQGAPVGALTTIRKWFDRKYTETTPTAEQVQDDVWLSEDMAIALMKERWSHIPRTRHLRAYCAEKNALRRCADQSADGRARVHLLRSAVVALVTEYVPLLDHLTPAEMRNKTVMRLLATLRTGGCGSFRWIIRSDFEPLSRAMMLHRAKGLSLARASKSGCPKRANQPLFSGLKNAKNTENAFAIDMKPTVCDD